MEMNITTTHTPQRLSPEYLRGLASMVPSEHQVQYPDGSVNTVATADKVEEILRSIGTKTSRWEIGEILLAGVTYLTFKAEDSANQRAIAAINRTQQRTLDNASCRIKAKVRKAAA